MAVNSPPTASSSEPERQVAMRQLARTLLILGSVGACERAHPVVDSQERPAVGNIGQTGRPKPAAIAQPLRDPSGVPAVGNIGQTGAPTPVPKRRIQRAQRAAATRIAIEPQRTVERPLVSREARPMTGNVVRKGGAPPADRLAFQATDASVRVATERPLVNQRERPASANMGRRSRMATPQERLASMTQQIAAVEGVLATPLSDVDRKTTRARLDELKTFRRTLQEQIDHGVARDEDE